MQRINIVILFCLFVSLSIRAKEKKVIWLDEMNLSTMSCGWDEPKKNFSVEGWQKMKLNGNTYERGVGSHAISEYLIGLDGKAIQFSALVGVDDRSAIWGNVASVIFKVFVDNKLTFSSDTMKANMPPKTVMANLKKAKTLKLVIEDAGDGCHGDQADWAMAKIDYSTNGKIPKPVYQISDATPFLVSPDDNGKPSINGPEIYGARPGSPFLFRIPVSGAKPVNVSLQNLPEGLIFDAEKRIITGTANVKGHYKTIVTAKNNFGTDTRSFEIVIGDSILLTPLMGWNSWNAYGLKVTGETIKKVANIFETSGLAEYGYSYINVDDGWQAAERDVEANIQCNEKFPDMKGLSDYVHAKGLKFGIYSSPGPTTCGGFLGSYQHELQDVAIYNKWGVDLLKYDWCSYDKVAEGGHTILAEMQKPYVVMGNALKTQNRDIVYYLCQYGFGDVWKWGASVGGNMWRTTDDIRDVWSTLKFNTLGTLGLEKHTGPGGWNDPDLLAVGRMSWGSTMHNTRLKMCEQKTQMTLWAMMASPLIISCDLDTVSDFTLNLLKNKEVIAIDQDRLGLQASVVKQVDEVRILKKPLVGNKVAVAIVNFGFADKTISLKLSEIGISTSSIIHDVWRNTNLDKSTSIKVLVPAHGSCLYVVTQ